MGIKFTGDFKALQRWQEKVATAPQVLDVISVNLAEESIDLVKDGFENSRDPHGRKWARPLLRNGRPLEDTGGLKASWFRKSASRRGFVIASAKKYAVYHQLGTGIYGAKKKPIEPKRAKALRIPVAGGAIFAKSVKGSRRRAMVPYLGKLPAKWSQRFKETAEEVLQDHFR